MGNYFTKNLILMRKAGGFTQGELAKKLGLRRATISTYERGVNTPKLDTLIKLKKLFNVSIDDMIFLRIGVELEFKTIKDEIKM